MTDDKPPFSSVGEAMTFAYYNWPAYDPDIKEPPLSRMEGTNSREQLDDDPAPVHSRPGDLGPIPRGDLAAQTAAKIEIVMESMLADEREHLHASYLVKKHRDDAKDALINRILPTLNTGIHNRHLIAALVSRHYGKRGKNLTDRALRDRYKIGRHKLDITKEAIHDALSAIANRAEMKLYYALQARGVIR